MFFFETSLSKIRIASNCVNEFVEILAKDKICTFKHCELIKILLMDN